MKTVKNTPKISVITVCRNAAHAIEKTIRSVVQQDFADKEYIVVDGLSTDDTVAHIQKYEDEITVFISEKDTGIYDAMNKAVGKATGEWIIFMNAGDAFANKRVLSKIAPILQTTDANVVYGNILVANESGTLFEKKSEAPTNKHRMYFCHQSVFTRAALHATHPFDVNYAMSADFKFFKQLFLEGQKFHQVDFPITIYDKKGISNTQRIRGLSENIHVIKELDTWQDKLKFLPRLYFVIFWNWLRKKK